MAFTVKFYRVSEDPRCLTKTLIDSGTGANLLASMQVTFKDVHGLQDQIFKIKSTSYTRIMEGCNYVKVERGNVGTTDYSKDRYYIVDKVESNPTSIFILHTHLDVLMTFNAAIKALNVTLDRSETIYNGYLPDSDYTALGYRSITCRAFSRGLDVDSYILMTTG